MKKIYILSFFLSASFYLFSQTTYETVYSIFQTNCSTSNCHNSIDKAGNLDLEGNGATLADQQTDVYNNIYKTLPSNATAANKGNYTIYPGDPYRSFLFRKISNGFSDDNPLEASEGGHMPSSGNMSDYEKEVIRQWIVYGANEGADEVDLNVVNEYYTNGGIESVTNALAPPAANEGFQIHLGPFYIAADEEVEFLSKYETKLSETTEITKFQTEMGTFSHHYIVYKFTDDFGNLNPDDVPYGLRDDIGFDGKGFVITEQYSNTLETPQGSAFKWEENTVLDLNTHYINYSSTQVLKCEVYLNVYTQPNGTAIQEMHSQLIPKTNIPIPNNNQPITHVHSLSAGPGTSLELFVWGVVAHTHQYGKDFNIFRRNNDGSKGEQIYDGGCANGLPGCAVEEFDYQHLPFRFFDPFLNVKLSEGVIAEATYINDGPNPVDWGLTSDDEMMLYVIFFTLDTAGLNQSTGIISQNVNIPTLVYPNPVDDIAYLDISLLEGQEYNLTINDVTGKTYFKQSINRQDGKIYALETSSFEHGIYFYTISIDNKTYSLGKFVVK